MKEFKEGKKYTVNDTEKSIITIVKRTKCYVTIDGAYNGRFKVGKYNLFGMGENILLPTNYKNLNFFCFAAKEIG